MIQRLFVEDFDSFSSVITYGLPPRANPLVYASYTGLTRVVEYLINESAGSKSPDINADHCAALATASLYGHAEIVQLLLERGADVDADHGAALREASRRGHYTIVQLLLEAGADVNVPSDPLRVVLEKNHPTTVQLMSDQDSETNFDEIEARPADCGCYETMVETLGNENADVNASDDIPPQMALNGNHDRSNQMSVDRGCYIGASNSGARKGLARRMGAFDGKDTIQKAITRLETRLRIEVGLDGWSRKRSTASTREGCFFELRRLSFCCDRRILRCKRWGPQVTTISH